MVFKLRDFFNKIKWDSRENPGDYVVIFLSRGAPGDREEVSLDRLIKVYHRGFEVLSDRGVKYIPFHRVIRIVNVKEGKIIFSSPRLDKRDDEARKG